jgi:hypothetical protein
MSSRDPVHAAQQLKGAGRKMAGKKWEAGFFTCNLSAFTPRQPILFTLLKISTRLELAILGNTGMPSRSATLPRLRQ